MIGRQKIVPRLWFDCAAEQASRRYARLLPISVLGHQGRYGALQVMGSRQLIEQDLVDEYRLMIDPVLLGGGKTIFPEDGHQRRLQLVSVKAAGSGVLIYVPTNRFQRFASRWRH